MSKKINKCVATIGEVLLRLSTTSNDRLIQSRCLDLHFGGSELNTSVALTFLGVPVIFLSALPVSDLGQKAIQEIQQYNIDTSAILKTEGRMGLYFLEKGAGLRPSKVIYDRQGSSFSNLKRNDFDWGKLFKGANWFHWSGIIPALSDDLSQVIADAMKTAKKLGLTVSCDLNYRKTLCAERKNPFVIMKNLIKGCDIIVGGPDAFKEMLGIKAEEIVGQKLSNVVSKEQAVQLCKHIMGEFPNINHVAMTIRDASSISNIKLTGVLVDADRVHLSTSYELNQVVDRIGSGDSFMAGIIYGLLNNKDGQETIDVATALAAMKHSVRGDINCTSATEIKNLIQGFNLSIIR